MPHPHRPTHSVPEMPASHSLESGERVMPVAAQSDEPGSRLRPFRGFTAADEKLALSLYRRSVALHHVEHAILLGTARKYASWLEHGQGTPISSLYYFTDLFREVQQEISPQYWTYIAHKVETFERTWAGFAARGAEANKHVAEGQSGGCCGSTELTIDAPGPS
jgi:hypothetical protein